MMVEHAVEPRHRPCAKLETGRGLSITRLARDATLPETTTAIFSCSPGPVFDPI
jgi:hypothetical protein